MTVIGNEDRAVAVDPRQRWIQLLAAGRPLRGSVRNERVERAKARQIIEIMLR